MTALQRDLLLAFFAKESVLVDTVWERVPAAYPARIEQGGIVLDSPEEITVNKLTTLVSRSEPRDIVDLMLLERFGCSIEAALPKALQKDGGCTPATLAWVLSEVSIPADAALPGGVPPHEARAFLGNLVERLLKAAAPPPAP